MHRFFVPPESIQGEQILFPRAVAEQMRNVLRLAPGARVVALSGDGWECEVEVTEVSKQQTAGRILERRPNDREPHAQLTLYQCLLKHDHFEWVLQKCTEIGAARVVPVISERTVAKGGVKEERWARIAAEAAEQSGRGRAPEISAALSLEDALADCAGLDLAAIAWEEEPDMRFETLIEEAQPTRLGLFVGPEGGFSAREVGLARTHGVHPVTLGRRILRAETAAVVFCALALHRLGELG